MKTREQIIDILEKRLALHKEDSDRYSKYKQEALMDCNLDKANKYYRWELDSFMLQSELEVLLEIIKDEKVK